MDQKPDVSPQPSQQAKTPLAAGINYAAYDNTPRPSKIWTYLIAAGFAVAMISVIEGVIQSGPPYSSDQSIGGAQGAIFMISFIIAIVGIAVYAKQTSTYSKVVLRQFLADNGWHETALSTDDVATSLIGVGHSQKISQAFTGTYRGVPFNAVLYEYVTGSGRSQTTHYFADLHLSLKQKYPLIVLDNRLDEHFSFLSSLPSRIPDGKELQLEGNFNKRYKVTVLPGTEQEVLQVLTPDFMAELLDNSSNADVELEADKLFIIRHLGAGETSKATMREMFSIADVMIKNLGELSSTWQASSSPETVEGIADTALTARQKLVLKPKHIGLGGLIGLGLYMLGFLLASYISHHH